MHASYFFIDICGIISLAPMHAKCQALGHNSTYIYEEITSRHKTIPIIVKLLEPEI
jgi:hypothetical protein